MMLHACVHTDIQLIFLFAGIMFCKVPADTKLKNNEPLLLEIIGLGSCKPLVTILSAVQYITVFCEYLFKDTLLNI